MSQPQKTIYVTRDIERALGMEPNDDYLIAANRTPYSESAKARYSESVRLIDSGSDISDTAVLLEMDAVRSLIDQTEGDVLVFKNTPRIEEICLEHRWHLLNPPAALAEKVENKITQVEWLGGLATEYLPPFAVGPTKDMKWAGIPSVIQWAHGHTGDGTIPVNSAAELSAIQKQFPERPARMTTFVNGPSFTANVCVSKDKVLFGNISYQITGLSPFTDNPFATVGNDWGLTHSLLNEAEISRIEKIAQDVGKKMQESGWRGLFGIDVMRDDERDMIYLIEINARQPASTTFESFLQREYRRQGIQGLTTFEAHLDSLRDGSVIGPIIAINDGAQIIQRITKSTRSIPEDAAGSLELSGYMTIAYQNSEYNADLFRIQSMMGIMETHNKLNQRGKEIAETISN